MPIRAAQPDDASRISAVLKRSILQLCGADHGDVPEHIASWTANKSPQDVMNWMKTSSQLRVSLSQECIAAVGAYTVDGEILLLYVDPDHRNQGHSSALLTVMEHEIAALDHTAARLVSSKTAQAFYISRGWVIDGERVGCYSTDGQPMIKSLRRI